jgi:hypothetical protein
MKAAIEHSGTSEEGGVEGGNSFATTPSFSSGNSTWGQDEMRSTSKVQKEQLRLDITFDEWRSGKKARLLPHVATSPWLVIRNVNTQVCTGLVPRARVPWHG